MDSTGIALSIRVRDEWDLVCGLIESLAAAIDEVWILDDASRTSVPTTVASYGVPVTVLTAQKWSGQDARFGEGVQRDLLLQHIKAHSACQWVLQLDADERISDPRGLIDLTSSGPGAFELPLVDFYITPDDVAIQDPVHPEHVRTMFGVEVRWTLCLFRIRSTTYVSRGDVREPQGVGAVRRAGWPLIEHYGKAMSVEEWDRKANFYASNYPEYRDKWLARVGRAVHVEVSDFDTPLVRRGEPFDPVSAPCIYEYRREHGAKACLKQLIMGVAGRWFNRERVTISRPSA